MFIRLRFDHFAVAANTESCFIMCTKTYETIVFKKYLRISYLYLRIINVYTLESKSLESLSWNRFRAILNTK